jgi:hypothetical protein
MPFFDSRYYLCHDAIFFLYFLFTASCNGSANYQILRSLTAPYFTFFEFCVAGLLIAIRATMCEIPLMSGMASIGSSVVDALSKVRLR